MLDEEHWQAVARIALGAQERARDALGTCHADDLMLEGQRLCTDLVLPRQPAVTQLAGSRAWARLPLTLALGSLQVGAAQQELGIADRRARLFGAAFHAAAALIDHVVDDTPQGQDLFDTLDSELVRAFFSSLEFARAGLRTARDGAKNPLTDLVFLLLDACAHSGWSLVADAGRGQVWRELERRVYRLVAMEREGSVGAVSDDVYALARATSVGPSEVLADIALLAGPAVSVGLERKLRHRMRVLGELFWLVDDLLDLLADDRRGHLNALLLEVVSPTLRDSDLYRIAATAASRIETKLQALEAGPIYEVARKVIALWAGSHKLQEQPVTQRRGTSAAVQRGTDALLRSADGEFDDAKHRLRLPRLGGQRRETHQAVLFVRAVVIDALLDAAEAGAAVPRRVLDREVLRLLLAKHPAARGGWNYLPEVPELPPDIDDLGQVLQVLARHGGEVLARTGLEGARLAVDQQERDGGVRTWVLDPGGSSPADVEIRAYLPVMGGRGVHPEVVANFAAGLVRVDPTRWVAPLEGIARYLIAAQELDGSWRSKWYEGHFYGTYRAVWVLQRLLGEDAALRRAEAFLRRTVVDGGWGEEGTDPLATAFAVLTLAVMFGPDDPLVQEGCDSLLALAEPDGTWAPRPWIGFPSLDGRVVYGSRTITTAFAVKALCAGEQAV